MRRPKSNDSSNGNVSDGWVTGFLSLITHVTLVSPHSLARRKKSNTLSVVVGHNVHVATCFKTAQASSQASMEGCKSVWLMANMLAERTFLARKPLVPQQ